MMQHDWATVSFPGDWCEEERKDAMNGFCEYITYVASGNANLLVGHEQAAREIQTVFIELFCSF